MTGINPDRWYDGVMRYDYRNSRPYVTPTGDDHSPFGPEQKVYFIADDKRRIPEDTPVLFGIWPREIPVRFRGTLLHPPTFRAVEAERRYPDD